MNDIKKASLLPDLPKTIGELPEATQNSAYYDKEMYDFFLASINSILPAVKENSSKIQEIINVLNKEDEPQPQPENKIDFDKIFPIGSLYFSIINTNPSNYFGGTWELLEANKMLRTTSTIAETKGGSNTLKLTSDNIPSHSHSYQKTNSSTEGHTLTTSEIPSHSHSINITTASGGSHSHNVYYYSDNQVGGTAKRLGTSSINQGSQSSTPSGGAHSHTVTGTSGSSGSGSSHTHNISTTSATTGSTGSNSSNIDITNEYITCFVFKRIN